MRKTIGPEDFHAASNFGAGLDASGMQLVCVSYSLEGNLIAADHPVLMSGGRVNSRQWKEYKPLVDKPDLFLEFARLWELQDFTESVMRWIHNYGLPFRGRPFANSNSGEHRIAKIHMSKVREEAERANDVLRMYELSRGKRSETSEDIASKYVEELCSRSSVFETRLFRTSEGSQRALLTSAEIVKQTVQELCDLSISYTVGPLLSESPLRFKPSSIWSIQGLIGAMYMQMYWLITSDGRIVRCLNCNQAMSTSQIRHSTRRKSRSDRKFCNAACRQAHHRSKKSKNL